MTGFAEDPQAPYGQPREKLAFLQWVQKQEGGRYEFKDGRQHASQTLAARQPAQPVNDREIDQGREKRKPQPAGIRERSEIQDTVPRKSEGNDEHGGEWIPLASKKAEQADKRQDQRHPIGDGEADPNPPADARAVTWDRHI